MYFKLINIFLITLTISNCSRISHGDSKPLVNDDALKEFSRNHYIPYLKDYEVTISRGNGESSHSEEKKQYYAWDFVHSDSAHGYIGGVPIVAAAPGKIRLKRDDSTVSSEEERYAGWANYIVIEYTNSFGKSLGIEGLYLHIKKPDELEKKVFGLDQKVGDTVEVGDIIGLTGDTGFSTGPHLHYQVQEVIEDKPEGSREWFSEALKVAFVGSGIPKTGDKVTTALDTGVPLTDFIETITKYLTDMSGDKVTKATNEANSQWECKKSEVEKNSGWKSGAEKDQAWTCDKDNDMAWKCVAGLAFSKACKESDRKWP